MGCGGLFVCFCIVVVIVFELFCLHIFAEGRGFQPGSLPKALLRLLFSFCFLFP